MKMFRLRQRITAPIAYRAARIMYFLRLISWDTYLGVSANYLLEQIIDGNPENYERVCNYERSLT